MNKTKLMDKQLKELPEAKGQSARSAVIDEITAPYLVEFGGMEYIGATNAKELIRIAFESGYSQGHAEASARDKENLLAEITGIS